MARSPVRFSPTEHEDVIWFFSSVLLFSMLLARQVSILCGVRWSEVREAARIWKVVQEPEAAKAMMG